MLLVQASIILQNTEEGLKRGEIVLILSALIRPQCCVKFGSASEFPRVSVRTHIYTRTQEIRGYAGSMSRAMDSYWNRTAYLLNSVHYDLHMLIR
jgi:hypothetical protein